MSSHKHTYILYLYIFTVLYQLCRYLSSRTDTKIQYDLDHVGKSRIADSSRPTRHAAKELIKFNWYV